MILFILCVSGNIFICEVPVFALIILAAFLLYTQIIIWSGIIAHDENVLRKFRT